MNELKNIFTDYSQPLAEHEIPIDMFTNEEFNNCSHQ